MSDKHTGIEQENFEKFARDPGFWFMKASTLFQSSAELMRHTGAIHDVKSVAHMLRGMGTEALLKGLWFEQNPGRPEKPGTLGFPKGINHHDLVAWAEHVELGGATIPRDPLRILTLSIQHTGRYPSARTHRMVDFVKSGVLDPSVHWLPGHDEAYWPFIHCVAATYKCTRKDWGESKVTETVERWRSG